MSMNRIDRLREQGAKLRSKLHRTSDPARQKLLLMELVGVLTALQRAEMPLGSSGWTSNREHRCNAAARHAEVERDFAGALARYAPSPTASRPAVSSATAARV